MSKNSQFVLQEDLLEALILLLSQASIKSRKYVATTTLRQDNVLLLESLAI